MDHYIDIRLRPDPEFPASTLMNVLFGKLHLGLVKHGQGDIGISFPDVRDRRAKLGARLRLHGSSDALRSLMQLSWLQGMGDHLTVGDVSPIPASVKHRVIRRVQAKSSPERLRRRLMARAGIDAVAALQQIPDSAAETLTLPYLSIASSTTGQRFRLFIQHMPLQEERISGEFGAYGLSATATVPWF
jgi:CRISPR-associated endonuclease Csy4